jgi:hypothetical protein
MGRTTRAPASEPRMPSSARTIGRVPSLARGARRAIARVAFRGQLGPVGGDREEPSGWRR